MSQVNIERLYLARSGTRLDPPDLDRLPPPFPPDHPRAALLRRTGCVIWLDNLFETLSPDPAAGLIAAFERLRPLQSWLGEHL